MALFSGNLILLGAVLYLGIASSQVVRWGRCPNLDVKQNFTIKKYMGDWYEQYRYPAAFEKGLECVQANYSLVSDGKIRVKNTGQRADGEQISAFGYGFAPCREEPAKLVIKFDQGGPAGAYWVLDTDYKDFSIVWACTQLGPWNLRNAWLLSRNRTGFSHDSQEQIERTLRKQQVEKAPFMATKQIGCN